MHNFQVGSSDILQSGLARARVLERDVSSSAYWYPVPLQDMQDAQRAVPAVYYVGNLPITSTPPYWMLTKGAGNVGVQFYVPRHPRWINGVINLEVHYTTDDASGGNIVWEVACQPVAINQVLVARTFVIVGKAAPAAANAMDVKDVAATGGTNNNGWYGVNSSHAGMIWTLGRRPTSVSDTHTGDVMLHKVVCKYREIGREQGEGFNASTWKVS